MSLIELVEQNEIAKESLITFCREECPTLDTLDLLGFTPDPGPWIKDSYRPGDKYVEMDKCPNSPLFGLELISEDLVVGADGQEFEYVLKFQDRYYMGTAAYDSWNGTEDLDIRSLVEGEMKEVTRVEFVPFKK